MSFGNGQVPPVAEPAPAANGTDLSRRFGLRVAVWYAALFIGSAFAVVLITYLLTSSSLAQRDHEDTRMFFLSGEKSIRVLRGLRDFAMKRRR